MIKETHIYKYKENTENAFNISPVHVKDVYRRVLRVLVGAHDTYGSLIFLLL